MKPNLRRGQLIQFVSLGKNGAEEVRWQAIFHRMDSFEGQPKLRVHTALKGSRDDTWLAEFWPERFSCARFGWKIQRPD